MSVQLLPRTIALAKLLALGSMAHAELKAVCGWADEEFMRVVLQANREGLVTWTHWRSTRWYSAGKSLRRSGARRRFADAKKFARHGNKTPRFKEPQLQSLP